jgi:hypothetical protein
MRARYGTACRPRVDGVITGVDISDEELTAQALAADPDQPLAPDALPFRGDPSPGVDLLPDWYMPRPALGRSTPARRAVAVAVVAAALIINGLGFCITYGQLSAG